MKKVTYMTRHLTPLLLQAELRKLKSQKPDIYLYHIKHRYQEAIRKEVAAIKGREIRIIEDGQVFRL